MLSREEQPEKGPVFDFTLVGDVNVFQFLTVSEDPISYCVEFLRKNYGFQIGTVI
jgi:hypothetical protein